MFSGSLVSTLAVSTHSRPKAAALFEEIVSFYHTSFNTQPPEGGCLLHHQFRVHHSQFQHTAARRRLRAHLQIKLVLLKFQHTAARRRLLAVFPNSSPPLGVSTHSRPKAAAVVLGSFKPRQWSFNTQPPEGGCISMIGIVTDGLEFQHTAARRRLRNNGRQTAQRDNCFNTQPPEGGC